MLQKTSLGVPVGCEKPMGNHHKIASSNGHLKDDKVWLARNDMLPTPTLGTTLLNDSNLAHMLVPVGIRYMIKKADNWHF